MRHVRPVERCWGRPRFDPKFAGAEFALSELRAAAQTTDNPDKLAAIALAVEAFATVRQVIGVLAA